MQSILPILSAFCCSYLLLFTGAKADTALPSDVYGSVFRIEVATQNPDYQNPWNSGHFSGGIGTGFLIGENQILTNAHVVSNAKRIIVTAHGNSKKNPARVKFIAHDCDLALLELDDFSDFTNAPVFSFGNVPTLESQVRVIGYPIGGERLSVTRGVVSRIDYSTYSHSSADQHLVIQIDAAINPGNSGGPVIQDNKVIGVAFQGRRDADNTGYIIPTPVIHHFLQDIKDGQYDHYADLAISTFPLYNQAMRGALQLPPGNDGVLVSHVISGGSCDGTLKSGDVLFAIDQHPIDAAGQVAIDGTKVNLNEIVERKFAGDTVQLRYRSNGTWHDETITLKNLPQNSMYSIQYDVKPRYTITGGLVFQPLNINLFSAYQFTDFQVRKCFQEYLPKGMYEEYDDVVILTRILDDSINSRLADFSGMVLDKINNTKIRSLKQAQEVLEKEVANSEFLTIELLGASRPLVLPCDQIKSANERIMQTYSIMQLSNLYN